MLRKETSCLRHCFDRIVLTITSDLYLSSGDQVLEWNGIPLTGKTFEDVQRIIAQPNGELELVVRP